MVFDVPIHVQIPVAPQAFRASDGRSYLAYYAFILSFAPGELVFDRLHITDTDRGTTIADYDTTALARSQLLRVAPPDPIRRETARRVPPGRFAVLRTWIALDSAQPVPLRLTHQLSFAPIPQIRIARSQQDTDAVARVTLEPVAVDTRPAVVIGPPLRGGPWRASGGAGPNTYHRGTNSVDGYMRLPELFAVDFQKVDSAGNILPNPFPNTISNEMFYSDRAEVLAVADGKVVLIRDGMPANVPTPSGNENMPIPLSRESSAGNQLSLEIAPGIFAVYAHLAPHSIRVRLGDRVRRGQVIGLVGNVGNSKNPHLHFGIANRPEINASDGIPWVVREFELWGHQTAAGMPDIKRPPVRHRNEMLLQDAVVRFP